MVNTVDQSIYIPVLKWRQGEKMALKSIEDRLQSKITPLIELVNDEGEKPDQLAKDIHKYWKKPAYIDVYYRGKAFAINALENLARYTDYADTIPVVRLDTPPIMYEGIINVATANHNGIAVRIPIDSTTIFNLIEKEVMLLLNQLRTTKHSADLILDFGFLENRDSYATLIQEIHKYIPLSEWRKVIVSGGSFPVDLSSFTPNEDNYLDRLEWKLWQENKSLLSRETIFSDYTVRHPIYQPSRAISGSISLRYTLDDKFQIFRGKQSDKNFKYMVHALNIGSLYANEYSPSFSWGDRFIAEKAHDFLQVLEEGRDPETYDFNPGGSADWVATGVSHHINVVLKRNLQG